MEPSPAHAYLCQFCQDTINQMAPSIKTAMAEKLQACLDALKPIPKAEQPPGSPDHG